MMLEQPGYAGDILGEEWEYYRDDWGEEYACISYQQNDYNRWFEQCFTFLTTYSYDEILEPFLENGYETIDPDNSLWDVSQTALVGKRDIESPDWVHFFQQIGTDKFLMLVEMTVTSQGNFPLQTVYETLAADVMDYVLLDMLVKSRAIPRPTPTPLSSDQEDLYHELGRLLIAETGLETGWEALGDDVFDANDRVCRYFELRVNEDVRWVHLVNCIYHKPSDFDVQSLLKPDDVPLESVYVYEGDFIMYGENAGHIYYDAWLFQDGYLYLASLESHSLVGDTVESVFNPDIDDLLNHVLMSNLGVELVKKPPATPTATLTPEAGPKSDNLIIREDFNGNFDSEWNWIRAGDNQWNLMEKPGFLQVYLTRTTQVYESSPDTLFLHWIEVENFEIITRVLFEPERNFQKVGLVIYEDRDNYVALLRAYADVGDNPGNAIYFDNISLSAPVYGDINYHNYSTPITNPSEVYLRLKRDGNTYIAYYSLDGQSWIRIGEHTSPIEPVSYGFLIGKSDQPISAAFDYFELYELP
jgi:hypothetical protein